MAKARRKKKPRKTVSPSVNGRTRMTALRLSHDTLAKLDAAGELLGLDRSGLIKAILTLYLDERATSTEAKITQKTEFDKRQPNLF